MSSQSHLGRVLAMLLATLAVLCAFGTLAAAQDQPAPKWELFAGYSFIYPNARLHAVNPFVNANQESNPRGLGAGFTYNVNRWFGLTVDFSATPWASGETPAQLSILDDAQFYNVSFGPKLTYRRKHFAPFIEGLVGWHHLTEDHVPLVGHTDTFGFMLGGGVDVPISEHFGLRLARADFVFSNHQFPPDALVESTGVRGVRLQTGVIFMFGGGPPPVPASCSVSVVPMEVMAGEPVQVTASGANFRPNRTLTSTWTSSGGKASGTGMGGSVDTTGLAPGSYNVSAQVSDGRKASANCSGSFTVKEAAKHPPHISCSANPPTVRSGESSTINCTCTSPDNRSPLSYTWNTNAGTLSGSSGASATLDTAGLPSGPVSVGTTCTDDRGLSDATTTMVTVEAPPAVPQSSKLGECDFKTARVDNACKAVLDDVALRLQRDADSKAVIVGYSGAKEGKGVAAQRASNAKTYLVKEKGIDASRIELRTGMGDEKKAEFYIVPAGATFSDSNTVVVMEK
jgi:outer membrane protein OmpA-like peptidoglycan-associated protein